jgi:hypothetical protein
VNPPGAAQCAPPARPPAPAREVEYARAAAREAAIAAGTLFLKPTDLALRLGFAPGRSGRAKVIAMAKAGIIPFRRPSPNIYLFLWPDVLAALPSHRNHR